jgi:N-acetylmuramoyl-L-alanine amidase
VYNCVPETMKAWHAGESVLWNEPDVNSYSIGVELERSDNGIAPYPKPQIDALLDLAVDISARYRIPLHAHVGHNHVCLPKGRKVDPAGFDWYTYLNALGHRLLTFKAVVA